MDLSRQVAARAARYLIKRRQSDVERVEAAIYLVDETFDRVFVVLKASSRQGILQASASGSRWQEAALKAICELGECFAAREVGLSNRSGIAGGLFRRMSIERARAELVERDAFLYHYRHALPFSRCEFSAGASSEPLRSLVAFRMVPACPDYSAVLVTDRQSADGAGPCLFFGTAAHADEQVALRRAASEYWALKLAHQTDSAWCEAAYRNGLEDQGHANFHHAASRDPRNQSIFRALCTPSDKPVPRPLIDKMSWSMKPLTSIVRGFRYVRVQHPGLMPLEFGQAEPNEAANELPRYHPFW